MGFSQRIVELKSAIDGGASGWQSVRGRRACILFQQNVSISQPDIAKCVLRIEVRGLMKLVDRALQSIAGPFVPKESAVQVVLVSFSGGCIILNEALLF